MKKHAKLLKQITLFGVVGGGSLLVDLLVTTSLYDILHTPAYLAGTAGFLAGFFFSFPINRKHVFKHNDDDRFSVKIQALLYGLLCLFNLTATALIMEVIVTADLLNISLAKMSVTALIAIWNFLIFKLWIFSKRPYAEVDTMVVQ